MSQLSDADRLVEELAEGLRATAREVVPRFLAQMPRAYFDDTDAATRRTHLRAILAARASGQPLEVTLRSDDGLRWTFVRDRDYPGLLAEMMSRLPTDRPLRTARVYSAADGHVVLDVFEFDAAGSSGRAADGPAKPPAPDASAPLAAADSASEPSSETAADVASEPPDETPCETVDDEASGSSSETASELASDAAPESATKKTPRPVPGSTTARRSTESTSSHRDSPLFREVSGTESTVVELHANEDADAPTIFLATANADPRELFQRVAERLNRYDLDVRRAHLDLVDDPPRGTITMLKFLVRGKDGAALDPAREPWLSLRRDLLRLKWLDDVVLEVARDAGHALAEERDAGNASAAKPDAGASNAAPRGRHEARLIDVEVLRALCSLAHQLLWRENRYGFARERLFDLANRHREIALRIARLLLDRFDPTSPLEDRAFEIRAAELRERIFRAVADEDVRRFLDCLMHVVEATLRCNAAIDERYALAMRLDPMLFDRKGRERPYGVFFVHGRGFDAFHVRFRDIARGGVRAVRPHNAEQHVFDTERLYDEVYELAWAQQLKNKDIPEGGSKAVVLVDPSAALADCVKAFADGLLDLITPDPVTRARVVDRLPAPELLYLGPDENISPDLIEWIVERAERRGYPLPNAFMSSKPGTGVNHKEFGVTSEGLTVFLEAALRATGIDPRSEPFTVKLTGGPDGDVAGNELRILQREFGPRARVVGIADGSGVGEDPDGLDPRELLRLVDAGLPIACFDRRRLGPRGRIVGVDEPDGAQLRNSMHHRVEAHAFVPAGGRPETIHAGNWREFLDDAGRPTSRVIVEGANLFLTPEARERLAAEAGVLVVKDSSANKTGVICSSYEIVASMALDEDELREIKPDFVVQVIDRLRALARREARLLFDERHHQPHVTLPALSVRVSETINRAADAIAEGLARLEAEEADLAWEVVVEHLPPVLVSRAGERLRTRIPEAYLHRIAASSLASRIVYREGLSFLEALSGDALGELAMRYLRQERETRRLVEAVERSSLAERDRIAELLRRSGTRGGLASR